MFVRLVTSEQDAHSRQRQGVFQFAYALDRSGVLTDVESRRLASILDWFETNLPLPRESGIAPKAIFWFKPGAETMVLRLWRLAEFVREHGAGANLLRTTRPGYIRYEDEIQVAAVPFRDTFRMRMSRFRR
jgi:hypothetical protein